MINIQTPVFVEISNAEITRHWFMYGKKPLQKMILGKYLYSLIVPYDISTASFIGRVDNTVRK